MRACLDRPPTALLVAWNSTGVIQLRVSIPKRIVGLAVMPRCSRVFLRRPVEAAAVGIAQLFPNPPMIVGPELIEIAMPIAKEDHLHRFLQTVPTA